jgi:hypothetical protein
MRCVMKLPILPLAALLLAGCGGGDDVDVADYFNAAPYANAACNHPDGRLTTRREMRLFQHEIAAPRFAQGLQRYYHRYGLTFFSQQTVQGVDQQYALDTNEVALSLALRKEFPGVDLNDESLPTTNPELYQRIVKSVMNFVFQPVLAFARGHTAGTQLTNLVVLPQILRPGGEMLFPPGAEVAGLAISPALLQRFASMDVPELEAWKSLDLPADFTPMMFLDGKLLSQFIIRAPELVDLVAAHEFGHTGGLIHREEPHNLMLPGVTPGESTCTDGLDDDQIQTMRETLGISTPAPLRLKGEPPDPVASLQQVLPAADLGAIARGDRKALARFVRHFLH